MKAQIMTISSIQVSSKSELSSGTSDHIKVCNNLVNFCRNLLKALLTLLHGVLVSKAKKTGGSWFWDLIAAGSPQTRWQEGKKPTNPCRPPSRKTRQHENTKCGSNAISGHDNRFCPRIVTIRAILGYFWPCQSLQQILHDGFYFVSMKAF